MSKMDGYVEAVHEALWPDGLNTQEEIRLKMQQILRCRLSSGLVGAVLQHIRKHSEELGWSIPHVKRGPPSFGDEGRFFVLPARRTREFGALSDDQRAHMDAGLYSSVMTHETQLENIIAYLKDGLVHESLAVHKDYIEDVIEMLDGKRLRRIINLLNKKRTA